MTQGDHPDSRAYDTWPDARSGIESGTFPVTDEEWSKFEEDCESDGWYPVFDFRDIEELASAFRRWHAESWGPPPPNGSADLPSAASLRGQLWLREPGSVDRAVRDWRSNVFQRPKPPFRSIDDASTWIWQESKHKDVAKSGSAPLMWWEDEDESAGAYLEVQTNPVLASLSNLSRWIANELGCRVQEAIRYILIGLPPTLPPLHATTSITPGPDENRISIVLTAHRPREVSKESLWRSFSELRDTIEDGSRALQWSDDDSRRIKLFLDTPNMTMVERCREWNSRYKRTDSLSSFSRQVQRAKTKLLGRR